MCVRVCVSIGVSVCGCCFHVPGRRTMCLTCCILVFTNNTFNSDTVLFPFVLIFSLHVINLKTVPPLSFSIFTYVFRLVSIVTFNFYSLLTLSLLGFRKCSSKTKLKIINFIVRFFHFHLKFVSNSA